MQIDKTPFISVIMPVYNGEKYLKKAIDSILSQSFTNFEFIIINDGSTDLSEKIIKAYKDERIRYIKNEVNIKLIKTLNKGIDLAKGKYIARMDCDDISFPDRFLKQINVLLKDPTLDGVCGKAVDLYKDNIIKRSLRYLYLEPYAFRFTSQLEISFCHPCLMIKADILKREKFLDHESALHIEDMEIGARLSAEGYKIKVIDEFLIYYRKNEEGVCFTHRDEQKIRSFELAKCNVSNLIDYDLQKRYYDLITEKKGFKSIELLKGATKCLNEMIDIYIARYNDFSKEERNSLLNWKRTREFSFYISAIRETKGFTKIIILFITLKNFFCIFDRLFVHVFCDYIKYWSPFSKVHYIDYHE